MNIVKVLALANDLPIQELRKYANGFEPRIIPPWIATGTLQRKIDTDKRMQNMMGGVQGEQPSIKEQIEQKAGLMAAQAMQQQQSQQQMAQRPQPGPTPENIPQPEPQPEAMMARGGLARVPMQFAFKPGGIVGYAGGGEVDAAAAEAQQALANLRSYSLTKRRDDPQGFEDAEAAVRAAGQKLEALKSSYEREMSSSEAGRPAMNMRDVGRAKESLRESEQSPPIVNTATRTDVQRGGAASAPPQVKPPQVRTPQARPLEAQQAAPRPQGPPTGLPAAANLSKYFEQANSSVNAPITAPTAQGVIAEQSALAPAAMQEAAMQKRNEERRARADKEREQFEASKPSGLDDMIRVLGQSAQYKGGTGLGPAYTANQDAKRAAEQAMVRRQNELATAADTQEYEGAKELYSARANSMKQAMQSYQDRLRSRSEVLAQLAGVDQRSIDAALGRLNDMQLQQMRMAQTKADAARPGEGERFAAKYLGMIAANDLKGAEAYKDAYLIGKKGEPKEDTMAKKIAERRVEIASSMMDPKTKQAQLDGLDALEKQKGGGQSPQAGKVASRADVAATAKSSGKTEQQVTQDLKARGYTIQ